MNSKMLKATATTSVPLDSLSQRMPAGNFLVSADFQLFHFLHVFLLGHTLNRSFFYAKKEYLLRGTLRDSTCSVRMRVAYLLPFIVAVFVAASHVMSVTPRAVARSLIGRNVLPSLICTVADAGIVLPLTVTTFWPATIVMIL